MSVIVEARRGGRTRAGNAMGRTRTALLDGARRCLARSGARRTTMLEIAAAAGVAKGTLYNHFRTREDVYRALAEAELATLLDLTAAHAADAGPAAALAAAAGWLAAHPVLVTLRREEPASLARLLCAADADPAWIAAITRLDAALRPAAPPVPAAAPEPAAAGSVPAAVPAIGTAAGELALRWLTSFVLVPTGAPAAGSAMLATLTGPRTVG